MNNVMEWQGGLFMFFLAGIFFGRLWGLLHELMIRPVSR
jgi:hypothetical protein